jgi:hypothetical protein
VGIAIVRTSVTIASQTRFDTDPAINNLPFVGIGVAGSLVLDCLLLLACAMAFQSEVRSGRRVSGWLVGCALLPVVAVVIHGISDAIDLFRGATWCAGALACVAAMHIARDAASRRVLLAGSVAVLVLLVLRGGEQVGIEHAETVRSFERDKQEILAQFGWAPESPAAKAYERRLLQAEATGWFALSNLFSAMMAFGVVVSLGMVLERCRRLGSRAIPLLPVLLTLACALLLAINGSKGAVVAVLIGVVAFVLAHTRGVRWASIAALAVIALAALTPTLRGFLGEALGERSLYFRSQYALGAARAIVDFFPWGTGPDGFQDAYLVRKPGRSPEDVQSAHAMVLDWLAMLGPLAIGWIGLVGVALWRGGRTLARMTEPDDVDAPRPIVEAVLLGLAIVAVGTFAEAPVVTEWWVITRVIAAVLVAATFLAIDTLLREGIGAKALFAGVVAVVSQAQIEMLFFQPGMVVWIFVLLGGIAVAPTIVRAPQRLSWMAVVALGLASSLAAFGVLPQVAQDRLLDSAIERLAPVAEVRAAWRVAPREIVRGLPPKPLLDAVDAVGDRAILQAVEAALKLPTPQRQLEALAAIVQPFEATRRREAAELAMQAAIAHPTNWQAERAAIDQLVAAWRLSQRQEGAWAELDAIITLAQRSSAAWPRPRFASLLADLTLEALRVTPSSERAIIAEAACKDAAEREPFNARRQIALANAMAATGNQRGAMAVYRHALAIDDDHELDPLVQLLPAERASVERRIASIEAALRGDRTLPAFWPVTGE